VIPSPSHDEQRVAIITGASQGIGAGLAEAYRERGFAVIATARSIRPSEGPGIVTIGGDIADPDTAQRMVDEAVERFGRIDTLINNAGIYIGKPFTEYTSALSRRRYTMRAPTWGWARCTPSVGWARSRTWSVGCSISSRHLS
jgi:NAD(P)-dependent dehydrogenase (short-subunit alcohol dehydrogenase family)